MKSIKFIDKYLKKKFDDNCHLDRMDYQVRALTEAICKCIDNKKEEKIKLKCCKCGSDVSTEVPKDIVVKAWIECLDCLKREKRIIENCYKKEE